MSNQFYMISRFKDDDALNARKWDNISNFIERFGVDCIDEYLVIENKFVTFLKMFYDEFSTKPKKYYDCQFLASHIIVNDSEDRDPNLYYGLGDNVDERLRKLAKVNMNYIVEEDVIFLLTCWIRNLCLIYLFDVSTGSFLRATDADFCFTLMLHENFEVADIFQPIEHVYFDKSLDPSV